MKGLYFYKLVSPYSEDVTKDCKLTVNEIDHNFITLKDADIKKARFNAECTTLVLERNDGDVIDVDLSSMVSGITTNLDVDYDSVAGTITITYNNTKAVIDGLITKDNLSKDVLTEVVSDGTLTGKGSAGSPLGISPVEKTGSYKPAISLVNIANGEFMPKPQYLIKGDRYLSCENVSDYGYLYDFRSVKRINDDLSNGWRVPTKDDWDNMLNAIEPCAEYRNHNSIIGNQVLGKIAGKLLKSRNKWDVADGYIAYNGEVGTCKTNSQVEDDEMFDVEGEECNCGCPGSPSTPSIPVRPIKPKKISPNGVDAYGMRILPAGYGDGCQIMDYFGKRGAYWSATMSHVTDVYIKRFDYNKAGVVQSIESPQALFSLRLVKDFDGSNHMDVEYINGVNYGTKLMPSLNSKHGYAVWTDKNASFTNDKYRPHEPNGGMGLTYKKTYYINEWAGFNWVKKEMNEGESIVLLNGLDCEKNIEYRIVNGELICVAKIIYDEIMGEIQPDIDRIDGELTDLRTRVTVTEERIEDLEATTARIGEKLNQEVIDRIEGDTQLWDGLNQEIGNREHVENELWDAINNEAAAREQTDTQLWDGIANETNLREDADREIIAKINDETAIREDVEKQLWTAINAEGAVREDVDRQLWVAINNEGAVRDDVDKQLWVAINNEGTVREETDTQLWGGIANEAAAREAADVVLDDKIKAETAKREEEIIRIEELIDEKLVEHEGDIQDLKDMIELEASIREEKDNSLHEEIVAEAAIREDIDNQLLANINTEASIRDDVDKQLWVAINGEIAAREDVDNQHWVAINAEIAMRESEDLKLWEGLAAEGAVREETDTQLWGGIANEAATREEKDGELHDEIVEEIIKRQEDDAKLWVGINAEIAMRESEDLKLWEGLAAEGAVREETDTQLWGGIANETARAMEKEQYLDDRVITEEGSSFDCANGKITLKTKNPDNTITIALTGNYGTF